jgi:hypothetical protein
MKLKAALISKLRRHLRAFMMAEATIGLGVAGMTAVALLSGFTSGFFTMRMARENLRATQILLEKTETIRLYSWDQINTAGFVPATFSATYDPQSVNAQGLTYEGTLTITNAPISSSYAGDMKMVTVRLNWKTGNVERSREFSSYIARNGLQTYIY